MITTARIILLLLLTPPCLAAAPESGRSGGSAISWSVETTIRVHLINVGQGASTLVEFPCGAVLIDTGAQDVSHVKDLLTYLDRFFERRVDLSNTLGAVFITHQHKDHTLGLEEVFSRYEVKAFVENGQTNGSGIREVKKVRDLAESKGIPIVKVKTENILQNNNFRGFSNATIDPIRCNNCDPEIRILSGAWSDTSLAHEDYENGNNHSLVLRISFGSFTFLITGDLEEGGIEALTEAYESNLQIMDVDLYQVGHHGSHNATTKPFLDILTPSLAIIPVGSSSFGKNSKSPFTTYRYGHPRKQALEQLSQVIPRKRGKSLVVQVGTASKKFISYTVSKRIYSTAWDGNLIVEGKQDKNYRVLVHN